MEKNDPLDESLGNVHELETFLHAFLGRLDAGRLKAGEDVTRYAQEFGLAVPAVLQGAAITWEGHEPSHGTAEAGRAQTLVFTRPGHPDAIGLVIKCVKIGKWKICLECGWFWCRIVVTRRF
jgi:hypothetical protein